MRQKLPKITPLWIGFIFVERSVRHSSNATLEKLEDSTNMGTKSLLKSMRVNTFIGSTIGASGGKVTGFSVE
jgi:hypothetical protein